MSHPVLEPGRIGPLSLRNRLIKTATFEGMTGPHGHVSDALIDHHASMAAHGVALTTVAYGAVEDEGRTFPKQLLLVDDRYDGLARLAEAVHAHGGAVSMQLAHCGGFTKHARRPAGPSRAWNAYGTAAGRPRVHAMTEADMDRVVEASVRAARLVVRAGFDAVEVHCGHGYLLSQFLSPAVNHRRDGFGGALAARLRFPARVVRAVADAVGARAAVLVKMNLADGVVGGQDVDEAAAVARGLVDAGAHALVTSGGLVQRSAFYLMRGAVPLRGMASVQDGAAQRWAMRLFGSFLVRPWPFTSGFFVDPGRSVVDAVEVPVVALGGMDSAATMSRAFEAGYAFVAAGRALLADVDLLGRIEAGEDFATRCTACNQCVVEMDRGGVRCVLT